MEVCSIHEFYGHFKKCTNTDISVYVHSKGKEFPICVACWPKLAKSSVDWSSEKKRTRKKAEPEEEGLLFT